MERDGVEMAAKIIAREIEKPAPILTAENENVEVLTRGNIVACLNTSAKQQRITLRSGMIDFDRGSAVAEAVIEPFGFLLLEDTAVQ